MIKGGVAFLKEAQFLGSGPGPLPPCGLPDPPPPPHGSLAQFVSSLHVCTDLPTSMFCYQTQISATPSPCQDVPAKNQMSCLALHHHGLIINKDEIDTFSDISQILVKLCPVLVLPNKLV